MNKKMIVYFTIMASLITAGFFSIGVGPFKLSVFRMLVIMIFLMMGFDFLIIRLKRLTYHKSIRFSMIFMLFWFFYALLSVIWVKDFNGWLRSVYFIFLGVLLMFIMISYLTKKEDIVLALKFISVMIVAHNILGWFEVFTGRYFFLSSERLAEYIRKSLPVSMFGNTNDFALFLFFAIFILMICWANAENLKAKVFYAVTLFSSIILLVLTGSRASILGMILGLGVVLVSLLDRKKLTFLAKLSLLMLLIFVFFSPNFIKDIQTQVISQLSFNFSRQDSSDYVRMNLIRNGLSFLMQTNGLGTGAGNIEYWMANFALYNTEGITNIHNWWFEILVGYGVLTFALYSAFYARLVSFFSKKIRSSGGVIDKSLSIGITAMLIGFLVASVGSSTNISNEWLWVVWSIIIASQGLLQ
jgi:teichuronic acid biosynthesis protein TuaE